MPDIIHIITSGARHFLVIMAMVAMVMSTVGFHVHKELAVNEHAETSHRCSHGTAGHHAGTLNGGKSSVDSFDNAQLSAEAVPAIPLDPDGCGHCHCQVPTTDLPVIAGLLINSALQGVLLMPSEP